MLEDLSPSAFESWCRILLEREYGCRVENPPDVGDEGRDLLVHHPDGLVVVECKHYTSSTVGRPHVQKLHSAMITADSARGLVMTTGRFSSQAQEYAEALTDARIELWDGQRLAYLAEKHGLAEDGQITEDEATLALHTMPDTAFVQAFPERVLTPDRFHPGDGHLFDVEAGRVTWYRGYYVADYEAAGSLGSAVGTFRETWQGRAWVRADGRDAGLGEPPLGPVHETRLVPLREALEGTPGKTDPPGIQPHEAEDALQRTVMSSCSRTVTYTGRNNVTYTREVTPDASSTHVSAVRLVYLPRHRFQLRFHDGKAVRGRVRQAGDGGFLVRSEALQVCTVCRREAKPDRQVLCAVCHKAAHKPGFLTPDSHRCAACDATVCHHHARRDDRDVVCTRCAAEDARPARKRWLPHLGIAAGVPAGLAAVAAAVPGSQAGLVVLGALAALGPLARVVWKGKGEVKEWARY